jgi:hypothetical protein
MNKNIQLCQIILIGLLISFVNTQQQPAKIQTSECVLRDKKQYYTEKPN